MIDKKQYKNAVLIGGGSGTSALLEGLKKYPLNLSAIITTADNGGSSGKLREEFGMIPPGDIRQCLVALASRNFEYLNERFQEGSLQGHTLGNLLITLFYQKNKNFQQAIDELLSVTGAKGSLIPMTLKPVTLHAVMKDGSKIAGEKDITSSGRIGKELKRLAISSPGIKANPKAVSAINGADIIIVGPGNLFSSVMPNFLVRDIRESFKRSHAKKIYIANLFTQPGHTDSFTLGDFLKILSSYIGGDFFDFVIYNSKPVSGDVLKKHKSKAIFAPVQITDEERKNARFIGKAIARAAVKKASKADLLDRNPFLHDSRKIAKAILELI